MKERASGGGRHETAAKPAASLPPWVLPSLALLLAAWVHRRALGAFFSTDDFVRLEEAVGLLPAIPTLWRLLSEVLYVRAMLGLFGPEPLPFHVVSLALHLANTVFAFRIGRRAGLSAAGSCLASSVFGAFPLFYTVLLSAVNINDIMALTMVFLSLLALEKRGPARIAIAVGCFTLAFLSKEALLFVPLSLLLLPASGERLAGAARRLAPLLVAGVAFAGLYLAFRGHGIGTGGEAYAAGIGAHVVHNLMTYAWWSVDLVRPVPDAQGLFDPDAWRVGVWPLAGLALAAALSRGRRKAIVFGCAWWLLALAPVLPLMTHTYGHYLYAPMVGFAIAGAGAIEALALGAAGLASRARRGHTARGSGARSLGSLAWRAAVPAVLIATAIGYALRSDLLIERRVTARLGRTELALDPFTRKMEVARRAITTMSAQIDREGDSIVVFNPPGLGRAVSTTTGREVTTVPAGAPSYDLAQTVLGGGLAIRLFEPRIDSVAFVTRWTPAYRNFSLYGEGLGGSMVGLGRGPTANARFAAGLLTGGHDTHARDHLSDAIAAFPDDRLLRLLYAATLQRTGDPARAREHARFVIETAPHDTLTFEARVLLSVLDKTKP